MPTLLRFLQILTMVVWVGGLVFFAFVLAPVAFSSLPSNHIAGIVVGGTLSVLHVIGLVCGALFCIATFVFFRRAPMRIRGRYEMELLFASIMLLATAYLQFNVLPAMEIDRAHAGGDIEAVAITHPARIHFEKMHALSERVEGTILLFGLGVLFLMSRENLDQGSSPVVTER